MYPIKEIEELENKILQIDALNNVYQYVYKRADRQNRILKIITVLLSVLSAVLLIILIAVVRGMSV